MPLLIEREVPQSHIVMYSDIRREREALVPEAPADDAFRVWTDFEEIQAGLLRFRAAEAALKRKAA